MDSIKNCNNVFPFQVPVSELTGKTVLLYFSAHWCPPCRGFLPKLIDAYQEIKEKDNAIEVVFISSDRDQTSFDEFFAGMPWLALPFGDSRKSFLCHTFKVSSIPMLVAIGPTGRTVTKEARDLIETYGAYGYPFTDERIKQIEKVKDERHEHELVWMRPDYLSDGCEEGGDYCCDACDEAGHIWSYHCKECNYDLHPECALKNKGNKDNLKEEEKDKDGLVCEGEISQH